MLAGIEIPRSARRTPPCSAGSWATEGLGTPPREQAEPAGWPMHFWWVCRIAGEPVVDPRQRPSDTAAQILHPPPVDEGALIFGYPVLILSGTA
jgi:hypothetical protein